jgi:hypothetical protein
VSVAPGTAGGTDETRPSPRLPLAVACELCRRRPALLPFDIGAALLAVCATCDRGVRGDAGWLSEIVSAAENEATS